MNWAMPWAPAGDPAFSFQLDSAEIWAAMSAGLIPAQMLPALMTSALYASGTASETPPPGPLLEAVPWWAPPMTALMVAMTMMGMGAARAPAALSFQLMLMAGESIRRLSIRRPRCRGRGPR